MLAGLERGEAYRVRFVSADGVVAEVDGTAADRRDLADGSVKTRLRVPVPALPLGPAAIEVSDARGVPLASISDRDFTVAPAPAVLPSSMALTRQDAYRAAVGRDGTVYISADLSAVREAVTFDIWGKGLPLRFASGDLAFYNAQGFLMQLLEEPVPGLLAYDVTTNGKGDSSRLRYFRHEFATYYLAHGERTTHAIDADDPDWHLDGTPHIDHDHLIVAIAGVYVDGSTPIPGSTAPFTLTVNPVSSSTLSKTSTLTAASGGTGDRTGTITYDTRSTTSTRR